MVYKNILNPLHRLAEDSLEAFRTIVVWLSVPFLPLYRQCSRLFAFGMSILSTLASWIHSAILSLISVVYTAVYREVVGFFVGLDLLYFYSPFIHLLVPVLGKIIINSILFMVHTPLAYTLTCLGMLVGIGVLKYFVGESPAFQFFQSVVLAPFRFFMSILKDPFEALCSLIESLYNTVIIGRNPNPNSQSSPRHLIVRLGFDLFYVLVVKYIMPIPRLPLPGEPCDISDLFGFMWVSILKSLTKGPIVKSMLSLRLLRISVVHRDWLKRMMYSVAVKVYKASLKESESAVALIVEPDTVKEFRSQLEGVSNTNLQDQAEALLEKWGDYVVEKANEKLENDRKAKNMESIPPSFRENQITFERCGFTYDALPHTGYAMKQIPNQPPRHLNCDYVQLDLWVREHGRDLEGSAAQPENFLPNKEANKYIGKVMQDVLPEFISDEKNKALLSQISQGIRCEQNQSSILLATHSWFHKGIDGGKLALHTIVYG